jgi:hypothetical protein
MKHILVAMLLVLTIASNVFAFNWSLITTKSPSEQWVVNLLGKPSKAGTLYDQIDYGKFTRNNNLDIYMLEYDRPPNNHNKIFESPLGVDATYFMVWFAKPGTLLNNEGNVTRMFAIDFFFSGEDRDRAFTAFKFDTKCDNEDSSCFFTQKCWQVTISPSKDYKKYYEIFARKYEVGAIYNFLCLKAGPMGADCLDDSVRLGLNVYSIEPQEILKMQKACEEGKHVIKK